MQSVKFPTRKETFWVDIDPVFLFHPKCQIPDIWARINLHGPVVKIGSLSPYAVQWVTFVSCLNCS